MSAIETAPSGDTTFVGLALPPEVTEELTDRLVDVRDRHREDASWTRPDGWHVTLAFLGEVPAERNDEVVAAMRAAVAILEDAPDVSGHDPGEVGEDPDEVDAATDPTPGITAAGGEQVGPVRLQRAVTLGDSVALAVTHDGWLARLHSALVDELAGRFEHEPNREFRPHLTVARMRGQRPASGILGELTVAWKPIVWTPDAVHLLVSHLGDGPARYESVARVELPG